MKIGNGQFWRGDCLELMADIPDGSVDMILCDLPYGTTACKWDTVIPFEPLWKHYRRVAKPNAAIALTASQPFTTSLISSNMKMFKYIWVWEKSRKTGFLNSKKQPLRQTEDVCVFYEKQPKYNPQFTTGHEPTRSGSCAVKGDGVYRDGLFSKGSKGKTDRYPTNIIRERSYHNGYGRLHPTQKPVALFEYLIKTYTNPGDLVLDNCAGSGTTAIAAERTNRKWICIEKDMEYYEKACERVKDEIHRLL